MYLALGAPPRLWLLALLCCVVLCFLLESFLDCRELGGVAIAEKLLFLGAQAFPRSPSVAVTEHLIPVKQVISRRWLAVELHIRNNTAIHLDENAFQFLRHFLK